MRVGPDSPVFGPLLRTSCSADEICLSDSVPEVAEKYPNRQLELEVEPVQPPKLKIGKGWPTKLSPIIFFAKIWSL